MADDAAPLRIEIAGEDAALLRRAVAEGEYASTQAAVEAAIALFKAERDAYWARARAALARRTEEVRASIARGEGLTVDEARAQMQARIDARARGEAVD